MLSEAVMGESRSRRGIKLENNALSLWPKAEVEAYFRGSSTST